MARPRRQGELELSEGVRLLERYSILDRVGSGGMATIYRATDARLDRVVCVKLLRTTLVEGSSSAGSGDAVFQATYDHFLKEALALSKLQHPNTLRIYDFGYLDVDGKPGMTGAPFHVSEYLEGGNLETLVRLRGPLPPGETLQILDAVTGAVAEAHEHGIIHRDIKPSNILFARVRGELVPKLADFGIAHTSLKNPSRTLVDDAPEVSTVALFSPRWAAPEQLCGSPEGPRTDVYALGLLTTFMLAGSVLFADDDVRTTFNARVRGDTLVGTRLSQLGLPAAIARVLAWAMTARPSDRIASAREMLEALRHALRPAATPHAFEPQPAVPAVPPPEPATAEWPMPGPSKPGPLAPPSPATPVARQLPAAPAGLALEIEPSGNGDAGPQAPPERVAQHGPRRLRFVEVHERLDLSFVDDHGGPVRVRITMLPGGTSLNVKGLTCFVARPGSRPTPAVTVTQDGSLELVSSTRHVLGELAWSFGQPGPHGRAFVVDGHALLVPYAEAQQAVVLSSRDHDVIVMCRR